MKKLAVLTGNTDLALNVLPLIENNYASAATISKDEVEREMVSFTGVNGEMNGLLAIEDNLTASSTYRIQLGLRYIF